MDPEIDELKALVARQGKVIEETNHMIRGMRRSARLKTLWSVAWWLLIVVGSGAAYYYYLQPYITSIGQAYQSAQHGVAQAQSFPILIEEYFKHMFAQIFNATSTAQ